MTKIFSFSGLGCLTSLLLHQALCSTIKNGCAHWSSSWTDLGGDFCYIIENNKSVPWIDAVYRCSQEGGILASFHTIEEIEKVIDSVSKKTAGLYIGLRKNNNDSFAWVDKTSLDFTNWFAGQPDFADEKCVEMYPDSGKWNDVRCTNNLGYVCSVPKNSKPLLSKKVCPSTSQKWEDLHRDVCYIIETENKANWNDASLRCIEQGSSLASFHSIEEISSVVHRTGDFDEEFHIGLRWNGRFAWMDKSPVDLDFWNIGEPNDPVKKCTTMNAKTGVWSDVWCGKRSSYVCSYAKDACGGSIFSKSGTFSSPNYPDPYRSNENCIWEITVPEKFIVILDFQAFNVESGSLCQFDYVEIRDGLETDSPRLGMFCGAGFQGPVRSTGNKMSIKFVTDASDEKRGFLAYFRAGLPRYVPVETALRQLPDYFLPKVHDIRIKVATMKLNTVKERVALKPKAAFKAILDQISSAKKRSKFHGLF